MKILSIISELKGGQHYYIQQIEDIAENLASCLGEILSIAAQNIKIYLTAYGGVMINKILDSDYFLDKNK